MNHSMPNQIKLVCIIITFGVVVTYFSYQLSAKNLKFQDFMIPLQTIKSQEAKSALVNNRWVQWVQITSQRSETPAQKRLPDIIGIGVKKCGTGAMIRFLAQHPLVETSDVIEAMFFTSTRWYQLGLEYYKSLLPRAHSHQLIAEKSPAYFHAPGAIDRIKADVPNATFILSLCDPTNRALSDFVHIHSRLIKKENASVIADKFHQDVVKFLNLFPNSTRSLEDRAAIANEACKNLSSNCIFSKGIYFPHVSKWKNTFNASQLLILNGEKWMTNPGELLEQELDFLKLPKLITRDDFVRNPVNGLFCINRWWQQLFHRRLKTLGESEIRLANGTVLFCLGRNKGRTRNGGVFMRDDTRRLLRKLYFPYNQRLYKMLGRTFDW